MSDEKPACGERGMGCAGWFPSAGMGIVDRSLSDAICANMIESGIMAVQQKPVGERNRQAIWFMLLSVGGFSLIPLVIAQGAVENPFLFNAGWRLGFGCGLAFFLLVRYRSLFMDPGVWSLIIRRAPSWAIFFAIISQFEYAIFSQSIRFIDVAVATILFETYHILIILFTAWLFRRERRYREIRPGMGLLLLLGFAGFGFVVAGEVGRVDWVSSGGLFLLLPGLLLAMLSAVIAACSAFNLRWGADVSAELAPYSQGRWTREDADLFCVVVASVIANMVAIPLNAGASVLSDESLAVNVLLIGVLWGFVINAMANVAWRYSNLITDNLGINALSYATPIVSLLWLFLFRQVDIARVDYLFIGAAAIVTANLIINFEAEVRFGFKALILGLWTCGAFVYLRDEFLAFLSSGGWVWPRGDGYLGVLAMSATVFILLLSFRVARLTSRIRDEDVHIFTLFQTVDVLARRNLIDPVVRQHILSMEGARNAEELQSAYGDAKDCFTEGVAAVHSPEDLSLLADAEAQLNVIAHSRQHGVEFGELFALVVFGAITVFLALASRPEVSGWPAFMFDVFAALFSAVIIFLVVNVWDLQRDRAARILHRLPGVDRYGVVFRDMQNRSFEQGMSVVVGFGMTICYVILLGYKWLS